MLSAGTGGASERSATPSGPAVRRGWRETTFSDETTPSPGGGRDGVALSDDADGLRASVMAVPSTSRSW